MHSRKLLRSGTLVGSFKIDVKTVYDAQGTNKSSNILYFYLSSTQNHTYNHKTRTKQHTQNTTNSHRMRLWSSCGQRKEFSLPLQLLRFSLEREIQQCKNKMEIRQREISNLFYRARGFVRRKQTQPQCAITQTWKQSATWDQCKTRFFPAHFMQLQE